MLYRLIWPGSSSHCLVISNKGLFLPNISAYSHVIVFIGTKQNQRAQGAFTWWNGRVSGMYWGTSFRRLMLNWYWVEYLIFASCVQILGYSHVIIWEADMHVLWIYSKILKHSGTLESVFQTADAHSCI